jgi:signal transduction histidine kinase
LLQPMKLPAITLVTLVAATAGTLVYLFLIVLIIGYRRRRAFERILFFLSLSLFLFYAGFLLALNSTLYYTIVPGPTTTFSMVLMAAGLAALPGLFIHANISYGQSIGLFGLKKWHTRSVAAGYLISIPFLLMAAQIYVERRSGGGPVTNLLRVSAIAWVGACILATIVCAGFQLKLASASRKRFTVSDESAGGRKIQPFMAVCFAALGIAVLTFLLFLRNTEAPGDWLAIGIAFLGILPGAGLIYTIVRFNFLGMGAQKNLVYAISGAFLALLYLGAVRRVSAWLEPVLPPEATWSIMLFMLVGFFEPLQRVASRLLRRQFQEQVDRVQKLGAELQREAQHGEIVPLLRFAEERIRDEFGLEQVQIRLQDAGGLATAWSEIEKRPVWAGQPVTFQIGRAGKGRETGTRVGELIAVPIGSVISGETFAALEFLAEQLPAVIELCRTIDQKLTLERELAERERMALVGQMTASISHNLKNPLGSMKTVLQVQLENESLPVQTRKDLGMVLVEVDRLGNKLTQLLRYARPAVRAGAALQLVQVSAVAEQSVALLRHEAEQRGGRLDLSDESGGAVVQGSEEPLADIFSNLVVNAIEAVPKECAISVRLTRDGAELVIEVTDNGPGVSTENRARLFQPFFTTKPSGTGLGLAIVERRAAELGGAVTCESPVANGGGARFIVRLPAYLPAEAQER